MQEYYLRVEAVNLDSSVYDTYDISTIRGGSFMLLDAFEGMEQKVAKLGLKCEEFTDIGSAASVGLYNFKTDSGDVKSVVESILQVIRQNVEVFATLVYSFRAVDKKEPFTEALKHLLADCRWKQYQQPSIVLPREKSGEKACDLDGLRPAAVEDQVGGETKLISPAVKQRKETGRRLRNQIYKELLERDTPDLTEDPDEWLFTRDLETLSLRKDAGKLDGKIAFIYLDGNRFGRIRDAKCSDAGTYREFQEKIRKELRIPALQALLKFARQDENRSFRTDNGKIRLETLLWGGDEIEWVVPAWQALNVLSSFFTVTKPAAFQGITLTHSAGVVFCHHNLPILQIRRYARQLCDMAKEDIPTDIHKIGQDANRFAFINIVSFDYMTGDTGQFMKSYYYPADAKDFVLMADMLPILQQYLPAFKRHFPSTKLHELIEALKNKRYKEVDEIYRKSLSLLSEMQRQAVETAHQNLIGKEYKHWFWLAELLNYLE